VSQTAALTDPSRWAASRWAACRWAGPR
jgi:hypothetical protein